MSKAAGKKTPKYPSKRAARDPWLAVLAAVLLTIGVIWYARSAAQGPQLGESFASQGQQHIAVGAPHAEYNSFPATSGPHYGQPQPWGVFGYEVAQETLVHNLEHGGIVIQYHPELLKGDIRTLETIQARFPNKTVVAPNRQLKTPLALTAWRRLYTLDTLDEQKIVRFIESYKNRAPERFPD